MKLVVYYQDFNYEAITEYPKYEVSISFSFYLSLFLCTGSRQKMDLESTRFLKGKCHLILEPHFSTSTVYGLENLCWGNEQTCSLQLSLELTSGCSSQLINDRQWPRFLQVRWPLPFNLPTAFGTTEGYDSEFYKSRKQVNGNILGILQQQMVNETSTLFGPQPFVS